MNTEKELLTKINDLANKLTSLRNFYKENILEEQNINPSIAKYKRDIDEINNSRKVDYTKTIEQIVLEQEEATYNPERLILIEQKKRQICKDKSSSLAVEIGTVRIDLAQARGKFLEIKNAAALKNPEFIAALKILSECEVLGHIVCEGFLDSDGFKADFVEELPNVSSKVTDSLKKLMRADVVIGN